MEETIRGGAESLDPDRPEEGEEELRSRSSRTVSGTAAAESSSNFYCTLHVDSDPLGREMKNINLGAEPRRV
jgi:hypothetical protein